jgi:hypothetical protein
MVGLPRQPIKNEGCGEEEHPRERRDESSKKQFA